MPTPNEGESRDDFVSRCISVVLEDETAEDQDQAVAICNSMWEEANKELTIGELITVAGQILPSVLMNPIMKHGTTGDLQAIVLERQKNMTDKMERKTFSGFVIKADEAQGIIETVFAVFGNIDQGDDVIHPGAFTKTFAERGGKVRVLDAHRTDSVLRAIGKPLMFKEVNREELPPELLAQHPEATGGAFARVQMLMATPEGKGAFIRLKEKAVDEWSFGYDALDVDFSQAMKDGKEITVRNLRTLKLYEISPVLFGMNEATTTVSAKDMSDDDIARLSPKQRANLGLPKHNLLGDSVADISLSPLAVAANDWSLADDKLASIGEVENKAFDLSQRVDDICVTFYAKFPDIHNPNHNTHIVYWAKQVWDEFLIVDQEGTLGRRMWKIAYGIGDSGDIEFSQQSDWIEVTIAFVPIAPREALEVREAPEIVNNYNLTMRVATDKQDDEQAGPDEPPTSSVLDEIMLLELEIEQLEASYDSEEHGTT